MDKQQFRDHYTQAFYQSLEEGKIEVTAIPAAQLQAICRAAGDAAFAALQAVDAEEPVAEAAAEVADNDEERRIWTAKSELTLGLRYELTSQRLRVFRGMFGRAVHEVDLINVREVKMQQNIGERVVNIGDVILVTSSREHPELRLENIKDPLGVQELVRKAYLAEQKRRGLIYREES